MVSIWRQPTKGPGSAAAGSPDVSVNVDINDDQISQYQRDGAVLLRNALGREEMELLEQGLEESHSNPGKRFSRARGPGGEGETFLETFPCLQSPSLKKLLDIGRIPEIAARMMRAPSAQLILDQVFYKEKGFINPTPWHQDTPYLRVRGDEMVRVWVTCDFSPRELTLQIVRGSHRWNVIYDPRLPESEAELIKKTGEGKMLSMSGEKMGTRPLVPEVEKYRDSFDILSWDVNPGDALVFNGNMLHAAGGVSDHPTPRRAYASMWGGPDLRYIVSAEGAIPTLADVNGFSVPDGARVGDYRDAFPVGWEERPGAPA